MLNLRLTASERELRIEPIGQPLNRCAFTMLVLIVFSFTSVLQVLDPRTRLVLFRLLQRGTLTNIHGCISTGKEANVYHAINTEQSLAIKIYKTSILTFKDRERYVAGEFRCVQMFDTFWFQSLCYV